MNITLNPPGPYHPGDPFDAHVTGAVPGTVHVLMNGAPQPDILVDATGGGVAHLIAPAVGALTVAVTAAQSATATSSVVAPSGGSTMTLGNLTAVLDGDGTVHCTTHATPDVKNVTLDEPLGTKLTEAAPANGVVTFPGVKLAPGQHDLWARGHDVAAGLPGGTATNTPDVKVTVAGPPPPPGPTPWGGKKLFLVSPGWLGSQAWAEQNCAAAKSVGATGIRSDVLSMAQADYLVAACRKYSLKLMAILGGSSATLDPALGPAVISKYKGDLVGVEFLNEPQTRLTAAQYASLLKACVPPCLGKGVPTMLGALNNSQGGSKTPAAHPWEWLDLVCTAFGGPLPHDDETLLTWHWYLSWPGEAQHLVDVMKSHGFTLPTGISETGISTYTGTQSYSAQASGLVADMKAQFADPHVILYGLFQPYDMHPGNGQFADNLGFMGKPAQGAVLAEAQTLRANGVIV